MEESKQGKKAAAGTLHDGQRKFYKLQTYIVYAFVKHFMYIHTWRNLKRQRADTQSQSPDTSEFLFYFYLNVYWNVRSLYMLYIYISYMLYMQTKQQTHNRPDRTLNANDLHNFFFSFSYSLGSILFFFTFYFCVCRCLTII